jgi:hypothetical protein
MSTFICIKRSKCLWCWKWRYFKTKNTMSTTWNWKKWAFSFSRYKSTFDKKKQTIKMLNVIVLNRILLKAHREIANARQWQTWTKHLRKEIEHDFQFKITHCFFDNKYDIECSCIDNNFFARFISTSNVNLILISTIIIINWIEHVFRYFHNEILLESWNLRQIYTRDKLNHLASRLRIEDRDLLKRANNIFLSLNCHENALTTLIIIIKNCYFQHVDKLFVQKIHFKRTFKSRIMINEMFMNFVWNRVYIDEAHQEQKLNNEVVLIFKKIDFHVRKWFLTKFFFESSFDQMISWIQILQLSWSRNLISSTNSWSRLEQYRLQLNDCIFDKIKTLSDIHKRFVKFNVENKTKLFNYIEKLSIVLNILWLRRIIDQFKFFNQFLIDVLLNIHQSILCFLSNHLRKIINNQMKTIIKRLKNELIDAIIKWKKTL